MVKKLRHLEDVLWKQNKYMEWLEHRMQELSDKVEQANVVTVSRHLVTHSKPTLFVFFSLDIALIVVQLVSIFFSN